MPCDSWGSKRSIDPQSSPCSIGVECSLIDRLPSCRGCDDPAPHATLRTVSPLRDQFKRGPLSLSPRRAVRGRVRHTRGMRVERDRENVFTVTATGQELSALIAGARLALDAMRASADAPAAAVEVLARVLDDFDRSRRQLSETPRNGDRR